MLQSIHIAVGRLIRILPIDLPKALNQQKEATVAQTALARQKPESHQQLQKKTSPRRPNLRNNHPHSPSPSPKVI
jgi:hypothetical protein